MFVWRRIALPKNVCVSGCTAPALRRRKASKQNGTISAASPWTKPTRSGGAVCCALGIEYQVRNFRCFTDPKAGFLGDLGTSCSDMNSLQAFTAIRATADLPKCGFATHGGRMPEQAATGPHILAKQWPIVIELDVFGRYDFKRNGALHRWPLGINVDSVDHSLDQRRRCCFQRMAQCCGDQAFG